jgi:hypothetical protein
MASHAFQDIENERLLVPFCRTSTFAHSDFLLHTLSTLPAVTDRIC